MVEARVNTGIALAGEVLDLVRPRTVSHPSSTSVEVATAAGVCVCCRVTACLATTFGGSVLLSLARDCCCELGALWTREQAWAQLCACAWRDFVVEHGTGVLCDELCDWNHGLLWIKPVWIDILIRNLGRIKSTQHLPNCYRQKSFHSPAWTKLQWDDKFMEDYFSIPFSSLYYICKPACDSYKSRPFRRITCTPYYTLTHELSTNNFHSLW